MTVAEMRERRDNLKREYDEMTSVATMASTAKAIITKDAMQAKHDEYMKANDEYIQAVLNQYR